MKQLVKYDEPEYMEYLDRVIDDLFDAAYKKRLTWSGWAALAGVSTSTVNRLGQRETKRPQLRTAFLLAKALNVNLPSIAVRTRMKRAA